MHRLGRPSPPSSRCWSAAAVVAVLAAVGLLSGCAANFDAETSKPYQAAEGVNAQSGALQVIDLLLVRTSDGRGSLVGGLVNGAARDDRLVAVHITGNGGTTLPTTISGGSATLPGGGLTSLSNSALVRVDARDATPGMLVSVTLVFARAAPVTTKAPVVDHTGPYATVPVPPAH